jgi:hypothetical protein
MSKQKRIKTNGLSTYRLKKEANNPREVAFADQWADEHKYHDLLALILRVPCDANDPECLNRFDPCGPMKAPLGAVTERDRLVAGTVIQWLGSNVGMCLMQEALKHCGGKLVWPDKQDPTSGKAE